MSSEWSVQRLAHRGRSINIKLINLPVPSPQPSSWTTPYRLREVSEEEAESAEVDRWVRRLLGAGVVLLDLKGDQHPAQEAVPPTSEHLGSPSALQHIPLCSLPYRNIHPLTKQISSRPLHSPLALLVLRFTFALRSRRSVK